MIRGVCAGAGAGASADARRQREGGAAAGREGEAAVLLRGPGIAQAYARNYWTVDYPELLAAGLDMRESQLFTREESAHFAQVAADNLTEAEAKAAVEGATRGGPQWRAIHERWLLKVNAGRAPNRQLSVDQIKERRKNFRGAVIRRAGAGAGGEGVAGAGADQVDRSFKWTDRNRALLYLFGLFRKKNETGVAVSRRFIRYVSCVRPSDGPHEQQPGALLQRLPFRPALLRRQHERAGQRYPHSNSQLYRPPQRPADGRHGRRESRESGQHGTQQAPRREEHQGALLSGAPVAARGRSSRRR